MKKILLVTVAAFGFAGAASAADLPPRLPVKAPPVFAPAFSWTGCYAGAYVGGAWTDSNVSVYDRSTTVFPGAGRAWGYNDDSSFIGGGTLGCNWQPVGSPFVLGLEGELGYLNVSGTAYNPLLTTSLYSTSKIGDWYGIVAGRLGYAWDRALLYVKGGVAFVDVQNSVVFTGTTPFAISASDTAVTWTVGGGLEWAFDPNWSIKAEYMYIAINDAQTIAYAPAAAGPYYWDLDNPGIHTVKVGINYRFGGAAAPVVARY